ncbi:MotE family protein [Acidimangrovimonas sediminis]|uniref:MotE family protein n=1 Tax=Acidimangrovimonas sediminis TaxID=2056283 RepID=UPI001E582C42|nr:hypothetical protein [Acidimangrovimonas sediminis]
MLRLTPLKLMIGLLAAAGAAKAATSLPLPAVGQGPERLFLASAAAPAEAAPAGAPNGQAAASAAAPADPATCATPEALLQSIRQERALIARQKAALDDRESKLALARQGISAETARLTRLKTQVEGLLKKVTDAHDADLDRLVKLYQAMKPQQAAQILNTMDLEVTVMVLSTMNERAAAPIMAQMTPDRVQAVSKIILERSKLPGDQNVVRVKLGN